MKISNILKALKTGIDKLIIIIFCSYFQMKAGMLYVNSQCSVCAF